MIIKLVRLVLIQKTDGSFFRGREENTWAKRFERNGWVFYNERGSIEGALSYMSLFFLMYLFYLFIFGCVWSSLLRAGFL